MLSAWAAVRHNWRPFVLIQLGALVFVALYYLWPTFAIAATAAGEIKAKVGILAAMAATAFAGFAIPEGAKRLTGIRGTDRRDAIFQIGFFMFMGFLTDTLYRTLGVVVGTGTDLPTVVTKLVIDQALFSPFVSIPFSASAFLWCDLGFSFRRLVSEGGPTLRRRYPAMLVTCWIFWPPVLAGLYSLPAGVQFLMFLAAQAAWSLLLVWMASEGD